MNVFLDNMQLDITYDTEKNVGDVLKALEKELEQNDATIIEVTADNCVIPADKLVEELFPKSLESVESLSVKSISCTEVTDIVKQMFVTFGVLSQKLELVPMQLQQNQDKEAMQTVAELADSLSLLFQTLPYMNLFPGKFENLTVNDKHFSLFVQEFPPFLEEFLKAVEANDTVTVGDIAEYEFAPRLKELSKLSESF